MKRKTIFLLILLVTASSLFVWLASQSIINSRVIYYDDHVHQWLSARTQPDITSYLLALTHLHDPWMISLYTFLITLYCFWKKNRFWILVWTLNVYGGLVLNLGLKHFFQRIRPVLDEPILALSTYSFPSGHTVGATVFYGTLIILMWRIFSKKVWRILGMVSAILMVSGVAISRLYLGVHYLSDVIAGMLVGILWLILCFSILNSVYYHKKTGLNSL